MRSSSLIQALLLWCCLQWRNARLYSVLFDVAPCYWKSLCKIPHAQNSWRYESIVLTNRIAGKWMNIKKIKLYYDHHFVLKWTMLLFTELTSNQAIRLLKTAHDCLEVEESQGSFQLPRKYSVKSPQPGRDSLTTHTFRSDFHWYIFFTTRYFLLACGQCDSKPYGRGMFNFTVIVCLSGTGPGDLKLIMDSLPLFWLNQTYLIVKSEASMMWGDAMPHKMNKFMESFSSTPLKKHFRLWNKIYHFSFVFSLLKKATRVYLRLVYSCNCI